jgi:hypothetical protein
MIHAHVMNKPAVTVISPLDRLAGPDEVSRTPAINDLDYRSR